MVTIIHLLKRLFGALRSAPSAPLVIGHPLEAPTTLRDELERESSLILNRSSRQVIRDAPFSAVDWSDSQRSRHIELLFRNGDMANWHLDLSHIPECLRPPTDTDEEYDGLLLKCARLCEMGKQRVIYFTVTFMGICGGWSGCAVINDAGAYTAILLDKSTLADPGLVDWTTAIAGPSTCSKQTSSLLRDGRKLDALLALLEIGDLETVPEGAMP